MTGLILKRASTSCPSCEWHDDDYDVLADGALVGRIMEVAATPVEQSWLLSRPGAVLKAKLYRQLDVIYRRTW
jgi:hypothetical protein